MVQDLLNELLAPTDVQINGSRPHDLQVIDGRFYKEVFQHGSLGLGESFMQGWWNAADIEGLLFRLIRADLGTKFKRRPAIWWYYIQSKIFNLQNRKRSLDVALKHYNIGNNLYTHMLGPSMMYSCAYWKDATNLDAAQEAKLDLICRKLDLRAGQSVLDIGCGWGGFAHFAATHYGVNVLGVSIAAEQVKYAQAWCEGLPVEIRLQDYRDLHEQVDRIVSIGMFEHVGYKNYRSFMEVASRNLKPDGLFLLHTIGTLQPSTATDPWIHKHIFPNGVIPAASQISNAFEPFFILEDWHNFGLDYERTLNAWLENFQESWPLLKQDYDEAFYRMWLYYLHVSAASFKAKHNQLWQIVLSKQGNSFRYQSVR